MLGLRQATCNLMKKIWNIEARSKPKQQRENQAAHRRTERHYIIPQPYVKCLGVHLSNDCSFQHHIMETVKKTKGMTGWVLRTFTSREPQVMLTLWKALLQPTLDYCSQLWSSHMKGDIQQLETVQRSFTRQMHYNPTPMKGLDASVEEVYQQESHRK